MWWIDFFHCLLTPLSEPSVLHGCLQVLPFPQVLWQQAVPTVHHLFARENMSNSKGHAPDQIMATEKNVCFEVNWSNVYHPFIKFLSHNLYHQLSLYETSANFFFCIHYWIIKHVSTFLYLMFCARRKSKVFFSYPLPEAHWKINGKVAIKIVPLSILFKCKKKTIQLNCMIQKEVYCCGLLVLAME